MIAARMLGRKEIGLGSLLESEFDIHLDKHYQKANWGVRPLSREMLQMKSRVPDRIMRRSWCFSIKLIWIRWFPQRIWNRY